MATNAYHNSPCQLVGERFDTRPVLAGKEVKQDVRPDYTLPGMRHREPRCG